MVHAGTSTITTDINGGFRQRVNSTVDSTNDQYTSFNFTVDQAPGLCNISTGTFILSKGVPLSLEYTMDGPIIITIIDWGGPAEYVAGTFAGNRRERYTNAVVSGTCSVRLRRY